jgi:FkbM family methyltransferase
VEENVEVLRRNFSSEIAQGRVVLVPKGVWDREEVLEMQAYDNTALDSFVLNDRPESKTAPQTIRLPVTTLDKIVAELGIDRIDLIKMDIEGAELRALAGAADTIRRFRPRLVIATENQSSDVRDIPSYVLSSFPNYRLEFGPTSIQADTGLRPTVAFFIPSAESVPDGQ